MPAASTSTFTELGSKYVLDRDTKGANPTSDITGGTGVIYMVEIDNEANSTTVYLKIRDATSATPLTTTANGAGTPHYSFIAPAYTKINYVIPNGAEFVNGLSMWCTTGTAVGTDADPGSAVIVKLITT